MAEPNAGARNLRVLSATNVLTGTHTNLLQVVLQPFVVHVAGSVVVLSILQGLATRMGGIVGALAQLAGGRLADRWGRRPVMLLGSAFNMASFSLFLATGLTERAVLLVPAFVFLGLGLLSSPASQSIVAESVEARGRAMAYSRVLFFLLLPAALIAFLGGFLADAFGYAPIFALSLALEATIFALFALLLVETLRERNGGRWRARDAFRLREPRLRGILLVISVDLFAWSISMMIVYGMAVKEFGFTNGDIGIIVGVWALVFLAATLPAGKTVERFGSRWMILVSEALGVPVMLGWILATTPLGFAIVAVVNGIAAATWVPALQTLVANSVEDRMRAEAIGQLTAIRSLLSFPAPFLGGLLYAAFGYAAPMAASLAGVLVAMVLILRYIHDPPKAGAAGPETSG